MCATISASHGIIQLVCSSPVDAFILDGEGREGRKQLLASILQHCGVLVCKP
jgi:hypothetical protein